MFAPLGSCDSIGSGVDNRPRYASCVHEYRETSVGPVHFKDYGGTGTNHLLVHGLGGSICNWDALAPRLTDLGRIVAIDLPGFGLTPPGLDWSLQTHKRAISSFAERWGGPVTLVGNSMGGLLSEMVASERPELVEALVLLSPATPPRLPDPRIHWPTARRLAVQAIPILGPAVTRHYLKRLSPVELVGMTLTNVTHQPGRVPMPVVEEFVRLADRRSRLPWTEVAVPRTGRSIAKYFARPSRFVEMIRRIESPTLVVQGIEDHIVSPTSVEWMCSLRPDWTLVQMQDTGHTPQLDATHRLAEVVESWLKDTLERQIGA